MKNCLFVVFLMLIIGIPAQAQDLIYYQDSSATDSLRMIPVSSITPLPINGVVSIGSATIEAGQPPTENLINVVDVSAVATDVASLANRKSINFFNHSTTETIWLSLDSAVASAAVGVGIPIFPYGFISAELDSVKVASVVASAACKLSVYQDGY